MNERMRKGKPILRVAALLTITLAGLGTLLHTRLGAAPAETISVPHNTTVARSTPPHALVVREQPMPFQVGEVLNYEVSWSAFSQAATMQLSIPEKRDLYGLHTWHFRGVAHTVSPVRTLFSIDDQFDSYTDTSTLQSRQFEMHTNELGKSANSVVHPTVSGQPTPVPGPAVVVPLGTRDMIGEVYALRDVDWDRTPEVDSPVYDGHELFELRVMRESTGEKVTVPAGSFITTRVGIHVFQYQKEVNAIHFVAWVAMDPSHIPVAMQADVPFGSLRAQLTSQSQQAPTK